MANYRFKTAEIEAMKKNILTHIECEAETKTAWRLRCAIEGQLMCCRPSKRDAARLERELALYEKLTKNDLPNWQSEPTQPATPTETPQIVRVEIVRDFDGSYYANLYDANGNGYSLSEEYTDFRTLKTLCKKEYGIYLPNLSQIEFENHGRKSYAYTSTEKPQISTEAAETVNVSAEGEKGAETKEISRKPEGREAVCRLAPAWAAKKVLKYGYTLYCFNLYPNGEFSISVENRDGCRVLTKDEFRKLCSEPPQSPETPQTVECATDAPKPRENAA